MRLKAPARNQGIGGPKPTDRCGPSPGFRLSRRFSPPGCRLNGGSGFSAHARHVEFSLNFDR
jgi:hypothetical protein